MMDILVSSCLFTADIACFFHSLTQASSDQQPKEGPLFQTPSTSSETVQFDTNQQPASQLGELPIKSDDPQFFAVGSGGMIVDENPDLTPLTETPEETEGSEVKELTGDFQTFGEWRKKVLEEELERENEKVKKMVKGMCVCGVEGGGESVGIYTEFGSLESLNAKCQHSRVSTHQLTST